MRVTWAVRKAGCLWAPIASFELNCLPNIIILPLQRQLINSRVGAAYYGVASCVDYDWSICHTHVLSCRAFYSTSADTCNQI